MTASPIHLAANRIADEFRALGYAVTIQHSVNRLGGSSSYLDIARDPVTQPDLLGMREQLRLSDHHSATATALDITCDDSATGLIAAAREAYSIADARAAEQRALVVAAQSKARAARDADTAAREAAARAMGQRRRAYFAAHNIAFDALRGVDRQTARDAFAAAVARGEA